MIHWLITGQVVTGYRVQEASGIQCGMIENYYINDWRNNMSKTITITPALERDIVNFCEDELNYHINDCDCREYQSEKVMVRQYEYLLLTMLLNVNMKVLILL